MRLTALIPASLLLTGVIASGAYSRTVSDGGRRLQTTLTGAAEAPKPGDPDGTGSATITVNPGQKRVCYDLRVSGIAPATGAHIHEAPVGQAGPIKVNLLPPSDGGSVGCVDISRELAMELIKDPGDYYVNVHNPEFPAGALRGQLAK